MKTKLAVILLCSGIFSVSAAFACGNNACGEQQYAYQDERGSDCQCADHGWYFNDCISKCEYCEAFGNIGAR